MIRIVGLSATLPNYKDVATFLGVNHDTGLFYFDASYRPVPLEMQFVGVTERNILASKNIMDDVAYNKVWKHDSRIGSDWLTMQAAGLHLLLLSGHCFQVMFTIFKRMSFPMKSEISTA